MTVDQAECLVVGLVGVVVAVHGVDEFEVGVLVVGGERIFMAAIQAFWLAASGVADRIGELAAVVAEHLECHVGHHDAGLVEIDLGDEQALALPRGIGSPMPRPDAGVGARLIAVAIWSPALFEIMIASTPWVAALVTNSICPVVSAQDAGPGTRASAAPDPPAASIAPSLA